MIIHSYRELIVWQRSIDLVVAAYALTKQFPKEEMYGLTSQIRRASISISSNIAEGRSRGSRKDFLQFLRMSFGSLSELETQIIIAKRLFTDYSLNFSIVDSLGDEVGRMLSVMIRKMNPLKP